MRTKRHISKVQMKGRILLGGMVVGVLAVATGVKLTADHKEPIAVSQMPYEAMTRMEGTALYDAMVVSSTETLNVQMVAGTETSPYDGRFIANITDTLNVRAEANTESDVVGKMYPGCVGDIVATEGDWLQITSGNVTGYVKAEYVLTGKDAEPLAEEYGKYIGTVTGDILKVRREATTDSEAIAMLEKDDQVFVTETLDGWYEVLVNDNWYGYVSSEYLSVEYKLDTAITIEEEMERIAAKKQEEAAAAAAQTQSGDAGSGSAPVATTQQTPVTASYDDAYLLACLVSMEAGNEPYEGQLAVANVVMNRLRSGRYGGTISDVVYAKGQFPSVYGSVMTGYLNNGPLPQAQQAANEALAGVNNIGGYTGFINVRYANYAAYSDYTIIGNHCFH